MSDIPPSNSNFVSQEDSDELADETISVSALRKSDEEIVGDNLDRIIHQYVAPIMVDLIRRVIPEQIQATFNKFMTNAQGNSYSEVQARRLALTFTNKPCPTIYVGEEIKAEDGSNIKMALIDEDSGIVVESGPEAEAKLQIDLLEVKKGDDDKIVRERAGTKLVGDLDLKLNRGIGSIDKIKLAKSAKPMKKGLFKLGAREVGTLSGIHIKQGKSESFTAKDYRIKYNMKSEIPELSDDVWRLHKISRNSETHKSLNAQGIHSVKDFLLWLFKDAEGLKRISGIRNKDWEGIVEHARRCKCDQTMILCMQPEEHNGVVQNIQVPMVVSKCSTLAGGSPNRVHNNLSIRDYVLDEVQFKAENTLSSYDVQTTIRNVSNNFDKFEMEQIVGDNQTAAQSVEAYAEHRNDITSGKELKKSLPCKSWVLLICVVNMMRSVRRKRVYSETGPVQKRLKLSEESPNRIQVLS